MGPPPGWYPDPWRAAPFRWWDGAQWTGHWSAGSAPTPALVPPAEFRRACAREQRMLRWARWALVAVLVTLVGQWSGALWAGHTLRQFTHDMQVNGAGGRIVRIRWSSPVGALYPDLFEVVAAPLAVVFLVWQHSAATVARGLGYPSRISPALGVGSWFIPVVNLWFPYWALSDTLPAGHPMRDRGLWAWLAYLGALSTGAATLFVALASTTAAIVVMVVSSACGLVAVGLGAQLLTAVDRDHRRRLASP